MTKPKPKEKAKTTSDGARWEKEIQDLYTNLDEGERDEDRRKEEDKKSE